MWGYKTISYLNQYLILIPRSRIFWFDSCIFSCASLIFFWTSVLLPTSKPNSPFSSPRAFPDSVTITKYDDTWFKIPQTLNSSVMLWSFPIKGIKTTLNNYSKSPKYWGIQAWANSVDPDQMPQNVASDLGLHCLPIIQQFWGMSTGSNIDLYKFKDVLQGIKVSQFILGKYSKVNPCPAEPGYTCLCKQCRSRSVGFWRSQMIWICTVCHLICKFVATTWIK